MTNYPFDPMRQGITNGIGAATARRGYHATLDRDGTEDIISFHAPEGRKMDGIPTRTRKGIIMFEQLSKDEILAAIVEGVKLALLEMVPDWDSSKGFFQAVESGVRAAVWSVATNATDAPCVDFFDSIKEGVKAAHREMGVA